MMSIQQRSARSGLRMFFSVFCPLAVAFAAVNSGFAQEDSNADPVDQNKLVRAIYDAFFQAEDGIRDRVM
eukprot:COSAG02_NODE_18187_length_955_cov_0.593458_2_plen_70_part_00